MVRPARRPHRDSSAHPPGTAAGGAPPGDGRTRRARHDPVAGIPHGRPHLAGFLYRSDLLSGGDSSRLYKHLVQEQRLLASVNAYISGDVDPGLFVFTGQLLPDTTPEQAEAAFRAEIEALQSVPASDYEVEKVKNKFEANTLFGELNVMNKAMNLGFYEMLGDLPLINGEVAAYRAVTTGDILAFSRRTFRPENCSILIYKAKK